MCGSAQVLVNKKAEGRRRRLGERDQGRERERERAGSGASHGELAVCVRRNCSRWRFGVRKSFGELRGI